MKNKKITIALAIIMLGAALPLSSCFGGAKPTEFDENNVVLSFSAMSDIHQQLGKTAYAEKLKNALDYSVELNGGKPLDVALFAGDLTEETWRQQNENYSLTYNGDIEMLKNTLESSLDLDKTAVFYSLGNHDTDPSELGEEYMSQMPSLFYTMLGEKFFQFDAKDSAPEIGLRHLEMNGYHFLSVQPESYWNLKGYSDDTLTWLDTQLKTITQENPNQYVFVTGHPPIYGTVFGSYASDWADNEVAGVLENYPQAIYFSGHIHNVLQDEIQISQNGNFTSVDCGSVKYTAVMNDIDDKRTTSFDNPIGTRIEDFSQGLFVEVDKNGNVRITRCDYYNRATIKDAWELSSPKKDKSHLDKYDNEKRFNANTVPTFDATATVRAQRIDTGISLTIDAAKDDDMIRYYYVTLYQNDLKINEYNFATYTYQYTQAEQMPASETYAIEGEFSGEYYVEVRAVDIWNKRSEKIFATFNV